MALWSLMILGIFSFLPVSRGAEAPCPIEFANMGHSDELAKWKDARKNFEEKLKAGVPLDKDASRHLDFERRDLIEPLFDVSPQARAEIARSVLPENQMGALYFDGSSKNFTFTFFEKSDLRFYKYAETGSYTDIAKKNEFTNRLLDLTEKSLSMKAQLGKEGVDLGVSLPSSENVKNAQNWLSALTALKAQPAGDGREFFIKARELIEPYVGVTDRERMDFLKAIGKFDIDSRMTREANARSYAFELVEKLKNAKPGEGVEKVLDLLAAQQKAVVDSNGAASFRPWR